jgi:hypothetical protein
MAVDVTALDLEHALGASTFIAIFADTGTDIVNVDAVTLILRAARADVKRYTLLGYDGEVTDVDSPLTDEIWALQLDFAKARAMMRGDAYVRDMGERLMTDARTTGKAIAEGLQRGSKAQPNPTSAVSPPTAAPGASAAIPVDFEGTSCGTPSDEFWREGC